jgi:hypothetical protein
LSRKQTPIRCAAVLVAALGALAVAACGDVSLYTALDAEDAPPVQLLPDGQRLLAGMTLVLNADGGTAPYRFSLGSGSGSLVSEDTSVTYTAPVIFGTELLAARVQVTDFLGETALAGVTVYKPLSVAPESFTVEEGQTRTFAISGGLPDPDYRVKATGGSVAPVDAHTWEFTATDPVGRYLIQVADAEGSLREVTVTVVGSKQLVIDPPSALLYVGGTASFQVRGGSPKYDLALAGLGSIDTAVGTADPTDVVYTAPSTPGSATLKATDSTGAAATVDLTVIEILSATYNGEPPSNKIKIYDNQSIEVLVSGGLAPYGFAMVDSTIEPPAPQGSIATGASDAAIYTPPVVSAKEWETISVEDAVGNLLFQLVEIKPAQ